MQALGKANRVAVVVGNTVLNAAQARRIQIAEPARLNWRWLLREHAQPGDARVTGEIDQNIDAVLAYGVCQLRFGQRADVPPHIRSCRQPPGEVVHLRACGVAIHFEPLPVVVLQQGQHE